MHVDRASWHQACQRLGWPAELSEQLWQRLGGADQQLSEERLQGLMLSIGWPQPHATALWQSLGSSVTSQQHMPQQMPWESRDSEHSSESKSFTALRGRMPLVFLDLVAWALCWLIAGVAFHVPLWALAGRPGEGGPVLLGLVGFASLLCLYYSWSMRRHQSGQSLGMQAAHLRLVDANGQPPLGFALLRRSLLLALPAGLLWLGNFLAWPLGFFFLLLAGIVACRRLDRWLGYQLVDATRS